MDTLFSSLDTLDTKIDKLRTKETESRIDAYERGELKAVSLETALRKRWLATLRSACYNRYKGKVV